MFCQGLLVAAPFYAIARTVFRSKLFARLFLLEAVL